jgi:hypothetical protein
MSDIVDQGDGDREEIMTLEEGADNKPCHSIPPLWFECGFSDAIRA